MIEILSVFFLAVIALLFVFRFFFNKKKPLDKNLQVPGRWIQILSQSVRFYANLSADKKIIFEKDVARFLHQVKISGVGIEVTIEDRLLIASSAVIPLFGFPAYTYVHLNEVLLYPGAFDRSFQLNNKEEVITGMVGTGLMEGKMILSRPALHEGFHNPMDGSNVGIHEFAHLFDKEDGVIDGIPPGFDQNIATVPWIGLVKKKIAEINTGQSDIHEYGATNQEEFFAVASEYFFESPGLMKRKHPTLYRQLTSIFSQDLAKDLPRSKTDIKTIGRNDSCPCGSGEKYKRCCL